MLKIKNIQNLVILGAGESGVGTALLAKAKGMNVFVSDFGSIAQKYKEELQAADIYFEEAKHSTERITSAEAVVKSPGIPDSVPIVKVLLQKNIPVLSEIEFASAFTKAKIIGITGSNGKTTTTALTTHVLSAAVNKVTAAGNIGDSFAKEVLKNITDTYVLELSSFQLDGVYNFNPGIAVITNLSPDHLDRYDYDYDKYIEAKFRLIQNQTEDDFFVYDADDKKIEEYINKKNINARQVPFSLKKSLSQGTYLKDNKIMMNMYSEAEEVLMDAADLSLKGKHNTKNAMAAATVAKLVGIRKQTIRESLSNFHGVPHRLETVLNINHVAYINDSKATNVNAAFYALEAVKSPIVWIVGGVDKGNDYSELFPLVREKVKAIVCLGVDNDSLVRAFQNCVDILVETQSMTEAVKIAYKVGERNDSVLLSPCCASFDLFENYEDRGNQFKAAVKNL